MPEMATRQEEDEQSPQQPPTPEPAEQHDQDPEGERDALVPPRQRGIQDVPAVELEHGEQVEHGDEQTEPAGNGERVQQDGRRATVSEAAPGERDEPAADRQLTGPAPNEQPS